MVTLETHTCSGCGFSVLSRLFFHDYLCYIYYMKERNEHMMLLRFMLAELLEKQSSPHLSSEKRQLCKQGIDALNAAVDALQVQVYA